MRIKLIGGPFHNTTKDVRVNDEGKPMPFLDFHQLQPIKKISEDPAPKDEVSKVDRYKLEEVWLDGRLSHYEYHHEGR